MNVILADFAPSAGTSTIGVGSVLRGARVLTPAGALLAGALEATRHLNVLDDLAEEQRVLDAARRGN